MPSRLELSRLPRLLFAVLLLLSAPTLAPAQSNAGPEKMPEAVEHTVKVDGGSLHARVFGEGAPTIVLLANYAGQRDFDPVIPDLTTLSTVLTYDRPGYGQSKAGDLPCHALQAAHDLDSLLTQLNPPKPYLLVGHGYGCRVARLYAANYPDNVGALLFEDPFHPRLMDAQAEAMTGADQFIMSKIMSRLTPIESPLTEGDNFLVSSEQEMSCGPLPEVPLTVLTSSFRWQNAAPPMLSAEGKETARHICLHLQEEYATLVPGGKYLLVEGTDLGVRRDKPEVFVAEVTALLEKVRVKD